MRSSLAALSIIVVLTLPAQAAIEVDSRIESVGLFKNGLAVITRVVTVDGPGEYHLLNVPQPVHGTFWLQSDGMVSAKITTREFKLAANSEPPGNLQRDLAGSFVRIRLRDSDQEITGTVVAFDPPKRSWERSDTSVMYPRWGGGYAPGSVEPQRFLILQHETRQVFVDIASIISLQVEGSAGITRTRNVLSFTVSKIPENKPATITMTYVARGMAWSPAYQINLADSSKLNLLQQAVIRNELEDLTQTEIRLISGFPNVEFSGVTSLFASQASLAQFFQQLNQGDRYSYMHQTRRDVISQQVVMSNMPGSAQEDMVGAIAPIGEGVDLHYQSIGRHTIAAGESMLIQVAQGSAGYERIVQWIVPDWRDEFGRPVDRDGRGEVQDKMWDAVRFRNPLKFAMTTAPVMFVDERGFIGQTTSYWTNAGESATVQINRALSLRARANEVERPQSEPVGDREIVNYGGWRFRRVIVDGELSFANHRNEEVTLVIRRRFTGKLIEAEGEPKVTLSEDGVYSVNERHELNWQVRIPAGQRQTLKYSYSVLVRH